MEWISVKDRLPEIPAGQYGVSVLAATFDPVYAELNNGNGTPYMRCIMGLLEIVAGINSVSM